VWLHADAAYGGFAALTKRGHERLAGIELTDSVTLDPHKWLYQPIECGSLLVRQGDRLSRAFQILPDYMKDAAASDEEVNFGDLGVQQTRTTRALKVWLSISYFGVDAFREAIDRSLDLARFAEERIRATPEFELTSPASLGIVCFRRRGPSGAPEEEVARLNAALIRGFEETGEGLVSSTRLRGKYTARMCCLNHTSRREDVERVLEFFAHGSLDSIPPARPGVRMRCATGAVGAADGSHTR
jgi:glutamate/tyrosine decarboxylase-like PLP-dependent enzyme